MPVSLPTHVEPGDAIRAQDFNSIIDALAELQGTSNTATSIALSPDQAMIAKVLSAIRPDDWIKCRITGVTAPSGPTSGNVPSTVKYNLKGVYQTGLVLTNQTPRWGRPTSQDIPKIIPAPVDMIVYIIRSPASDNSGKVDADLLLLPGSENISWGNCPGTGISVPPPSPFMPPRPLPIDLSARGRNSERGSSSNATDGAGANPGTGGGGGST